MSYTTNRQPQGISKSVVTILREGMIAEIVAINDYSYFISLTDNKEVREIFHHIMEEEKEHYGLFLEALKIADPEEQEMSEEVKEHINIPEKDYNKYKDYNYKGTKGNLLTHIRDAIKGELEAIVLYDYFIDNLTDQKLINIISGIAKDEKEHVEELTLALTILDKDKYGPIDNNNNNFNYK